MFSSSLRFAALAGGLALAVVACRTTFSVPKEVRGDVPLIITNNTIYGICSLHLTFADGSAPDKNWVHTGIFHPDGNERRKFSVKPGVYRLHLESCDHNLVRDVAQLPISEPTELNLNAVGEQFAVAKALPEVEGYRRLTIDIQLSKARQQSEQQQINSATAPSCKGQFEACGGEYGDCCEGLYCKPKDNYIPWCWSDH